MPDSRRLNHGEYHALPAHVHDLKYSIADADGYEELRGFAYKYEDARLFAAAPDLLLRLKSATAILGAIASSGRNPKIMELVLSCEALIAEVEGK